MDEIAAASALRRPAANIAAVKTPVETLFIVFLPLFVKDDLS
jgi:hypothetical protein